MELEITIPTIFLPSVQEKLQKMQEVFSSLRPVTSIEDCPELPPVPEGYDTWYTIDCTNSFDIVLTLPVVHYLKNKDGSGIWSKEMTVLSCISLRHIFVLPKEGVSPPTELPDPDVPF